VTRPPPFCSQAAHNSGAKRKRPDSFEPWDLRCPPPQTARVNLIVSMPSANGLNRLLWKLVTFPNLYFWCRLDTLERTSLKNPSMAI